MPDAKRSVGRFRPTRPTSPGVISWTQAALDRAGRLCLKTEIRILHPGAALHLPSTTRTQTVKLRALFQAGFKDF